MDLASSADFVHAAAVMQRLHDASSSLQPQEPELITQVIHKLARSGGGLIGRDLLQEDLERLMLVPALSGVLYLSRLTAHVYHDFVTELIARPEASQSMTDDVTILFSGRDSYPLLLAYQQAARCRSGLPVWQYAPFNRFQLYEVRDRSISDISRTKNEIQRYYTERGLTGRRLIVVDFGFSGSIERTHRVVMDPQVRPAELSHYLFLGSPKPLGIPNAAQKGIDLTVDDRQLEKVGSYLQDRHNTDSGAAAAIYRGECLPLVYALQEMGSGINESRADSLWHGVKAYPGTHYKFAPIQAIAASLVFLRGIRAALRGMTHVDRVSSRARADSALQRLVECYHAAPAFFDAMVASEDLPQVKRPFDPRLRALNDHLLSSDLPSTSSIADFEFEAEKRQRAGGATANHRLSVDWSRRYRVSPEFLTPADSSNGTHHRDVVADVGDLKPILEMFTASRSIRDTFSALIERYDFDREEFEALVADLITSGILIRANG